MTMTRTMTADRSSDSSMAGRVARWPLIVGSCVLLAALSAGCRNEAEEAVDDVGDAIDHVGDTAEDVADDAVDAVDG